MESEKVKTAADCSADGGSELRETARVPKKYAVPPVTAWRVSAPRESRFEMKMPDEHFLFKEVRPGDALLLLDETGTKAWGIRRVFLVRRIDGASIVYFDRDYDFIGDQPVAFTESGDPRALRKLDFADIESLLMFVRWPSQSSPNDKSSGDHRPAKTFMEICALEPADTQEVRAHVRNLLETIVSDELLGPAQGPYEEVVGMNVRDRYLIGRLGPRRVDGESVLGVDGDSSSDESPSESVEGNEDHIDRDEMMTPATDIAEEEPEEDVEDTQSVLRSGSLVPSSMGLTFCIESSLQEVEVSVSWGRYVRQPSQEQFRNKDGKPLMCWKRVPCGGTKVLPLVEGSITPYQPDESVVNVEVRGSVSHVIEKKDGIGSVFRLVTLFLVNRQTEPASNRDAAWLFQPSIIVRSPNGKGVFRKRPLQDFSNEDVELKALDMIYRHNVEFAVGHNVSIHATPSKTDYERAVEIRTTVLPRYEVPVTEVPGNSEEDRPVLKKIAGAHLLDMRAIARAFSATDASTTIDSGVLGLLVSDYQAWIVEQRNKSSERDFDLYRAEAVANLKKCDEIRKRLSKGIEVLKSSAVARHAFAFANDVMADQRVHSIYAQEMRQGKGKERTVAEIEGEVSSHEWRPFQLAFLLLSVPSLVDPSHEDRVGSLNAVADLLWFPTGGGKTEAYLGVAAFAMAVRRLQAKDNLGGLDSSRGLSVIMRYTLRLLTVQQFQRAATLLCAMELKRQKSPEIWGAEPFSLGLWVGRQTSPNTFEASQDSVRSARDGHGNGMSPAQLTTCPWCGAPIDPGEDVQTNAATRQTTLFCSNPKCEFSERQERGGIPVKTVDEEIYHRPPTMMIATVDKFAKMAWLGAVRTLFGYAEKECTKHGLVLPDDTKCTGEHKKPTTHAKTVTRIRPPDLIIQDEFHLISGPLGTMVGLYETAVDELCTWSLDEKTRVHPKIIASTATVRMADDQLRCVFARKCSVFPPSGIDVVDNFFSVQRPVEKRPGRDYLGVCALGSSRPATLIRTYVAFLTAGQALFNGFGHLADPYMTAVGYFNSLRELGGMRRLSEDDVQTRCRQILWNRCVARPGLAQRRVRAISELTSRVNSRDIPENLARLEVEFRENWKKGDPCAIDIVLATNMLSVGVDVNRLGLMIVNGQPKNTAEYIQATSRVGRRYPGVVCTVFSWARPRDFSHYEMFEHYHATFYKQVEAQSVTPFAPRALDRGLTGAFVSAMRLADAELAPNAGADALQKSADPRAVRTKDVFAHRACGVTQSIAVGNEVAEGVQMRIDNWVSKATQKDVVLGYESKVKSSNVASFLRHPGFLAWDSVTVPISMREVESPVRLIMNARKLSDSEEKCAPWQPQKNDDEELEAGAPEEDQT